MIPFFFNTVVSVRYTSFTAIEPAVILPYPSSFQGCNGVLLFAMGEIFVAILLELEDMTILYLKD